MIIDNTLGAQEEEILLADIYYLTNKLIIHIEKINSLIDKKNIKIKIINATHTCWVRGVSTILDWEKNIIPENNEMFIDTLI